MRKLEFSDLRESDRALIQEAGKRGGGAAYALFSLIIFRMYFWTGKHWMRGGPQ